MHLFYYGDPPVEGFLIRLTSQQGQDRRLGKMLFKRLYFSTLDNYLLFVRPAKANPPPPPSMQARGDGNVPTSEQITKDVPLTYDVDPDIPDQLIGDSLRLRQVITNLVGNAIKFTPSKRTKRGHVALTCRLVAMDENNVTLEFCVSDTGIGIAKDKLNLIFDTFCQADGSTTRVRP